MTFIELVTKSGRASNRLRNAVLRAERDGMLPYKTVEEFIEDGESWFTLLRIPGIGRATINELVRLIEKTRWEVEARLMSCESDEHSDELGSFNSPADRKAYLGGHQKDTGLLVRWLSGRGATDALLWEVLSMALNSESAYSFEECFRVLLKNPKFNEEIQKLFENNQSNSVPSVRTRISLDSLEKILKCSPISERAWDVLGMRAEGRTLEEVGACFSITRERVRQIEKQGKASLRGFAEILLIEIADALSRIAEANYGELLVQDLPSELVPKNNQQVAILIQALEFSDPELVLSGQAIVEKSIDLDRDDWNEEIGEVFLAKEWPTSIHEIEESANNIPPSYIKRFFSVRRKAEFGDGQLILGCRLKADEKMIFALRQIGRPARLLEISAAVEKMFGQQMTSHAVGAVLQRMESALIVRRGVYALYEQLSISDETIDLIRNLVFEYLQKKNLFVSVKIIFEWLNAGDISVDLTSYYELYGILQDDPRFLVRRGLMLALKENATATLNYQSLEEEVIWCIKTMGASTASEIHEKLSGHRKVLLVSISMVFLKRFDVIRTERGRYDLAVNQISESGASILHNAIRILLCMKSMTSRALLQKLQQHSLLEGGKFGTETIAFAVRQIGGHTYQCVHSYHDMDIVSYLKSVHVDDVADLKSGKKISKIQQFGAYDIHDLLRADPRQGIDNEESGRNVGAELGAILGSF